MSLTESSFAQQLGLIVAGLNVHTVHVPSPKETKRVINQFSQESLEIISSDFDLKITQIESDIQQYLEGYLDVMDYLDGADGDTQDCWVQYDESDDIIINLRSQISQLENVLDIVDEKNLQFTLKN